MEKIAFIICYNNEMYMNECIKYISDLEVPEDIETDIIGIRDAESLAMGYNAAMHDSDAKYKVYLHQDLLIVDTNFIYEVIDTFRRHPEYGMLGAIGCDGIVKDGSYWSCWNVGATYINTVWEHSLLGNLNKEDVLEVVAIDGQIMVTQYDVEWREDLFDGFDFYDISQCMEFYRAGYKVGIPFQNQAWCDHVSGCSKIENYDYYRRIFCEEYKEFGYILAENKFNQAYIDENQKINLKLPLLNELWNKRDIKQLSETIVRLIHSFIGNTMLWYYAVITEIVGNEMNDGICEKESFDFGTESFGELIQKYNKYRFIVKEIYYGKQAETDKLLELSEPARQLIIKHSCMNGN